MPLDDNEVAIVKLGVALGQAPRPTPTPDAEWMVRYMDWFFQTRLRALEDSKQPSAR